MFQSVVKTAPFLIALIFYPTELSAKDIPLKRLNAEATNLFRIVLKDNNKKASPCIFSSNWSTYPVDADNARKHLKVNVYANLVAPDFVMSPKELLLKAGATEGTVCDKNQMEAAKNLSIRSLLQQEQDSSGAQARQRIALPQWHYSFPVFNARYNKAIIILSASMPHWFKHDDGNVYAGEYCEFGYMLVYKKHRNKWTRITSEEIFTASFPARKKPVVLP